MNLFLKTNLLLAAVLICAACSTSSVREKENEVIDVVAGLQNLQELKVSDFFTCLQFVPLETSEKGLVGRRAQWRVTDRFVIVSTQEQCLLFEKESGRFLRQIGHIGNDPEAYRDEYGVVDTMNDRMFFQGDREEVVEYGLDGTWKGKFIPPSVGENSRPSFFSLSGDTLVGLFNDMLGGKKERLMIYTKAGDSILCLPNTHPLPSFEGKVFYLIRHEKCYFNEVTGMQTVMFYETIDPAVGSIGFQGISPFWEYKGRIYLKEVFNDTIYQVSTQGLQPHKVFHLGEYHWPREERLRLDKNNVISVIQVMETENLFFFFLRFNIHWERKQEYYTGIYCKSTGSVHINHLFEGIRDDIYNFFTLHPLAASPSGQLMAVIPAEKIAMWIEDNGANALPADLAHLKNIREDDNPVLVFIE